MKHAVVLLLAAVLAVAVNAGNIVQIVESVAPANSTSSSSASDCADLCPQDYHDDPACASDGRSFVNSCAIQQAACYESNPELVLVSMGMCPGADTGDSSTAVA
jgi:hypothetical protein